MHEILSMSDREVATNRARSGVLRIRCPHEPTNDLPRIFRALDDENQYGTLRYELDQLVVVGTTLVLGVMTLGCFGVNGAHLGGDDT